MYRANLSSGRAQRRHERLVLADGQALRLHPLTPIEIEQPRHDPLPFDATFGEIESVR